MGCRDVSVLAEIARIQLGSTVLLDSEKETNGCRIFAVGDIFPADHYFMIGHGFGSRFRSGLLKEPMSELRQLISQNDIVIGNLEAPLCESSRYKASYARKSFCGAPEFAKELSNAGFNIVNIANNHIMQHGFKAFDETLSAIHEQEISVIGLAGDEGYCSKPVFRQKGEASVGILGYSIVDDPYCDSQKPYAHALPEQIFRDVSRASGQCEILVVSIHGGQEGSFLPDTHQRNLFREIVGKGADIVIGHHTHVVQPMEKYSGSAIFYSLGNFIFDLPWFPESVNGAIAQIQFGENGKMIDANLIGTRLDNTLHVKRLESDELDVFNERLFVFGQLLTLPDNEYGDVVVRTNASIQKSQQLAKLWFFLKNFGRGNTREKFSFLMDKLLKRL